MSITLGKTPNCQDCIKFDSTRMPVRRHPRRWRITVEVCVYDNYTYWGLQFFHVILDRKLNVSDTAQTLATRIV